MQNLGSTETTAQIHPRKLTEAFVAKAEELAGSRVVEGVVEGLAISNDGTGARAVAGVIVDGSTIVADKVVIALGPWSGRAGAWLDKPLFISSQKYHSAVLQSDADVCPPIGFYSCLSC
jgi:glycine/D-amino acid oxidase-like deaminating enzyme